MSGLGRHDEAIAEIKRAQQLDPLNPAALLVLLLVSTIWNTAAARRP